MMLGAFLCHMSTGAAAISVDTEDAARPQLGSLSAAETCARPALPEPLPVPDSKIPKQGKKEKARGRGELQTLASS